MFAVLVALASLASLARYHAGLAWTARVLDRPGRVDGTGEATWTGRVTGETFALPSGERVLAATTAVWDRAPRRKGAKIVCADAAFGAITMDGRAIAFRPDAARVLAPHRRETAAGAPPVFVDLVASATPAPIPHGKCAVESAMPGTVLEVRALRVGDVATVAGCVVGGALAPCEDGRDLLSARAPAGALRALRGPELQFLLFAAIAGIPTLGWLVIRLSRLTASLTREARW